MTGPAASVRRLGAGPAGAVAGQLLLVGVAVVAGLLGSPELAGVALAGAAALDVLRRPEPVGPGWLSLRLLVFVAGGAASWGDAGTAWVTATAGVLLLAAMSVDLVDGRVEGLERHPTSRGLPGVGGVATVPPPARGWVPLVPELALYVSGLLLADHLGPAVLLMALGTVAALGAVLRWGLTLRQERGRSRQVLAAARRHLVQQPPTVLLYAGAGPESVHEIVTWLPTLEQLPQSAMLVLRNRALLDALPPTTVPALCVPGATDLLSLPLEQAQVSLFVANVGNNIHMLRVPGVRSAFIGHGDSDKNASANPFAKAYDEVWVAGPAGRDRYLRADVGVRPDAFVEVGRPQVSLVRPAADRTPGQPVTVLYAPTWEGWNTEQDYSSVATHGPALVRALLGSPVPVRLVYRPHPYAGRRSGVVHAAHRQVVALLDEANERAGHGPALLADPVGPERAAQPSAAAAERAEVARGEQLLAAVPAGAHVVVPPGRLSLVSCLNAADALVTDVSSVLTDFLASGKPAAVCDPRGGDPEEFVARFPAAGAAVVLPPGPDGAGPLLDVLVGGPDPSAQRRDAVRAHLLGRDDVPATDRFAAAVEALARRSHRRQPEPQATVGEPT